MLANDERVPLRYEAEESFTLPHLGQLLAAAGVEPVVGSPLSEGDVAQHRLEAVYFDTEDLRLAKAGVTLRRRTGGDDSGWHLRSPAARPTGSAIRLPPGRVPPGRTPRTVPDQLQSMVWAQTLGRPLQPVATVTTERTVRRLSDPTGRALIEVSDDRVTGQRLLKLGGAGVAIGAPARWREIELDIALDADTGDLVTALDAGLRRHGLREAAWSDLTRVLDGAMPTQGTGGTTRAGKGSRLTSKSTAGAVVLAHIHEQVAQVRAQDMPVRLDAPDAVHKMRVATRRLRSALSTFTPLFQADVVRPLRDELKWLAAELGAARDAEVMRDRVQKALAGEDASVAADAAHTELDAAYRAAHDRVLAEMDGDRYHRILTMLQGVVEDPPLRKRAEAGAGTALPPLVARTYDRVRQLVTEAEARPAGAEQEELWHDARKAAKQSRYAAESVAPVFGKDASAFAVAMEAVQEALGEHQDSVLTRERLQDLAVHASSTDVAFLYGRLHAQEEARSAESHEHFAAAWQAAGRKSLHRWLR